ncbi:MAG: cytochrome c [Bacteroidales bacterium]|nr:cytochrome c [Bacteroidales bacterium]
MKNMIPKDKLIPVLLIAVTAIMVSCDKTREERGREYMPDMYHSPAYDTYEESKRTDDGKSALKPVEGTVPRHRIPYPYPATFKARAKAGEELENPVKLTSKVLEEGKKQYETFCINCHGEQGNGEGYLYTSGKYKVKPKSIVTEQWKERPGGEIFHVITVGQGLMGAHGPQIEPKDRWKIVHYIQQKLQK